MIGGEPYTLGLFDTAGEKWSAHVIVTALDLAEMMLTMKVYQKRQKLVFCEREKSAGFFVHCY